MMEPESILVSSIPYSLGALTTSRLNTSFSRVVTIGEGDFGSVASVILNQDRHPYAVKRTHKPIYSLIDLQHRLQEVYALSSSSSDYVLRYHDAWLEQEVLHIMTERLEPVQTVFPNSFIGAPLQLLWDLVLQLSLGIHSLHCSGTVHVDIKPDNILCCPANTDDSPRIANEDSTWFVGQVTFKLGDFGLARPFVGSDAVLGFSSAFVGLNDDEGDRRYLCPYLLSAQLPPRLKEADMYSLGATIVELLGGDPSNCRNLNAKRAGGSSGAYVASLLQQSALFLDDVVLLDLLGSMIETDPTMRPTAFQVVQCCERALLRLGVLSSPSSIAAGIDDIETLKEIEALQNEIAITEGQIRNHGM